jgi:hypothetical protein
MLENLRSIQVLLVRYQMGIPEGFMNRVQCWVVDSMSEVGGKDLYLEYDRKNGSLISDKVESVYVKISLPLNLVYNTDESPVSLVQVSPDLKTVTIRLTYTSEQPIPSSDTTSITTSAFSMGVSCKWCAQILLPAGVITQVRKQPSGVFDTVSRRYLYMHRMNIEICLLYLDDA